MNPEERRGPGGVSAGPGDEETALRCHLIALDLGRREAYGELERALAAFPASTRILPGLWGVVSDREAPEIRDHLWQFIDPDDGIFVVRSGREAAWQDVLCDNRWLKEHL